MSKRLPSSAQGSLYESWRLALDSQQERLAEERVRERSERLQDRHYCSSVTYADGHVRCRDDHVLICRVEWVSALP